MQRSLASAFLGIAFFLFSPASTRAGIFGGIQGFATDAGSHSLAGVTVSVTSPSGYGATVTGANGFYALNGLPLDSYAVAFSKDGYLPQTIRGITVIADQAVRVNVQLKTRLTTIANVSSRASTSLVQAGVTADTYVVDEDRLKNVQGTQQAPSGFQAVYSVPGVIPDAAFGAPTIRGGALADVSFLYDGVALTDPLFGVPLNLITNSSFSLSGTNGFQISTGGYDVSLGNANSGILSQIIKRGTYPAQGQVTTGLTSAIAGHESSFDYGGVSQDNRLSYYVAFSSSRNAVGYGDLKTLLPLQLGAATYAALDNGVINLFYRFGEGNRNELQFLANYTTTSAVANDLTDPSLAPYASNNGNVQFASDPFGLGPQQPGHASTFLSDYTTLYPGQKSYRLNIGYADTVEIPTSFIQKLNFKRQISPSSYFEARLYRVGAYSVGRQPYNAGSFTDYYRVENVTGIGEAFDYLNQLDSRQELSLGAEGVYYSNQSYTLTPSLEPAFQPLEDLGCPQIAAAILARKLTPTPFFSSMPGIGGCYIAPFNRAMNLAVPGLDLPTDAAHAPLSTYVDDAFHADIPLYRYGVWIKDRYQPTDRLAVTLGLRWDKEDIPLPKDAALQNTTYYIDRGNVVTVPGQPISSAVTQPSAISPRFAESYQLTSRDAVRFSYGKNIQFAPLAEFINTHEVPSSLQSCTIANGCFLRLPGYGRTNFVTNLYQQVLLDLNTNQIPQYQPVLPQTSVNLDFSYEHDFGHGISLRITPYYSRGSNYVVGSSPLLFTLPSGRPIFGPMTETNAGKNENTGVELALQRTSHFGLSGSLNLTYDNTLANYDSDLFPTVNSAALAANHFYHVTYVAPLTGMLNLAYNTRAGLHGSVTVSYQSGFRYGVGKETFVFGPDGIPVQVLNTDLASNSGVAGAYYLTNPSNPGTVFAPNIVASRGTPEGNDPGTLFGPPITIVNIMVSQELGSGSNTVEVGVRAQNLFGNYAPAVIPSNPYYGFSGFGNNGLPSGVNGNACARGQTFACEPFQYNYSASPYELEQNGVPRAFTFFASVRL